MMVILNNEQRRHGLKKSRQCSKIQFFNTELQISETGVCEYSKF